MPLSPEDLAAIEALIEKKVTAVQPAGDAEAIKSALASQKAETEKALAKQRAELLAEFKAAGVAGAKAESEAGEQAGGKRKIVTEAPPDPRIERLEAEVREAKEARAAAEAKRADEARSFALSQALSKKFPAPVVSMLKSHLAGRVLVGEDGQPYVETPGKYGGTEAISVDLFVDQFAASEEGKHLLPPQSTAGTKAGPQGGAGRGTPAPPADLKAVTDTLAAKLGLQPG